MGRDLVYHIAHCHNILFGQTAVNGDISLEIGKFTKNVKIDGMIFQSRCGIWHDVNGEWSAHEGTCVWVTPFMIISQNPGRKIIKNWQQSVFNCLTFQSG